MRIGTAAARPGPLKGEGNFLTAAQALAIAYTHSLHTQVQTVA